MKALRQALRVLALLVLAAAVMGAGWLVRAAVSIEPPASAAEVPGPGGIFDGGMAWEPLSAETPLGPGISVGPPFGPGSLMAEPEVPSPTGGGAEDPFDPWGLITAPRDEEGGVSHLLNDLRFQPDFPEGEGGGAPDPPRSPTADPAGSDDPALPLARLPECGQRPLPHGPPARE